MINIPYSPSRLDTTEYLVKTLKKPLASCKTILDVGCGKLYFYSLLKDLKFKGKYTGIDLEIKKKKNQYPNIKTEIKRASILHFKSTHKFDAVVCLWVLEHIKDNDLAISKIYGQIKHGGVLVAAVPSIWTWPFEFGRHGYHYYSKSTFLKLLDLHRFKIIKFYSAGGILGFLFMVLYNWPRFLILIPAFLIYKILVAISVEKSSWKNFSKKIIENSIYYYHRSPYAVKVHNKIIETIDKVDQNIKILPSSYIVIAKKV